MVMGISLCMITKDEEGYIRDCLNSVKDFVDEIIVVDTGSTDKTKEIAAEFGAKMYEIPWGDDFSAARNESLQHATQEWVLCLDADEVLAQKDLVKIKELIGGEFSGFLMDQRSYTDNHTYSGWTPCDTYAECKAKGFFISKIVRLFKREGASFRNKVHEAVDDSILEKGWKIGDSKIPIHHYGYLKDNVLAGKREKYLRLGLEQIKETPNNPRPYYEAARIYKNTGRFKEAAEFFEKVASLKPGYRFVHTNLGDVYAKLGDVAKAEEFYKKAIAQGRQENAYINLGLLYANTKRGQESFDVFMKALQVNPKSAAAYNNLGVLLVQYGKLKEAFHVMEKGYQMTGLEKFKKAAEALRRKL